MPDHLQTLDHSTKKEIKTQACTALVYVGRNPTRAAIVSPKLPAELIQRVHLHQRVAGRVIHSTQDRGVIAGN